MSPRYGPILSVLFALALVPTLIHSYAGVVASDGRTSATIPGVLAGYSSVPARRNPTWGKRRFDSDDWIERVYSAPADELRLSVIRSYDPKSLYHHPELAVAYGSDFTRSAVMSRSDRPGIPVHVLSTDHAEGPVALYVLHYGDRFVNDPIGFQLRTAGELLFSGRKPMTLFFLTDSASPKPGDLSGIAAANLLYAAIDSFLAGGSNASSPLN